MRTATFERLFYLSEHEVTNKQFRAFAAGHDSGDYQETNLNDNDQPVVMVSWHEAAAYCNWLSKEDGLTPFYHMEFGKVVGQNPAAKGYRLAHRGRVGMECKEAATGTERRRRTTTLRLGQRPATA